MMEVMEEDLGELEILVWEVEEDTVIIEKVIMDKITTIMNVIMLKTLIFQTYIINKFELNYLFNLFFLIFIIF